MARQGEERGERRVRAPMEIGCLGHVDDCCVEKKRGEEKAGEGGVKEGRGWVLAKGSSRTSTL